MDDGEEPSRLRAQVNETPHCIGRGRVVPTRHCRVLSVKQLMAAKQEWNGEMLREQQEGMDHIFPPKSSR